MDRSDENGIRITEDIYAMLIRAVKREGKNIDLARKLGIETINLTRWLNGGVSGKGGKYIAWSIWPLVCQYLLDNDEIDIDDPHYMTRSQLIDWAERSGEKLSEDERTLLDKYRSFQKEIQKEALDYMNYLEMKSKKIRSDFMKK